MTPVIHWPADLHKASSAVSPPPGTKASPAERQECSSSIDYVTSTHTFRTLIKETQRGQWALIYGALVSSHQESLPCNSSLIWFAEMLNLPSGMNRMLLRAQAARRSALQWSESWLHPKSSPRSEAPTVANESSVSAAKSQTCSLFTESDQKYYPGGIVCVRGTFSCKCSSLKRLFACSKKEKKERGREGEKEALGLPVSGRMNIVSSGICLLGP